MAIPIIVGVAAAASAVTGVYKGAKSIQNNTEASRINDSAKWIIENAEEELDQARKACNDALVELGASKVSALEGHIQRFVDIFSQIKNVDFSKTETLDNLKIAEFSPTILQDMKQQISLLVSAGLGIGGGAAAGVLTAFGAYSGTMALATASTGTVISTLSGAAATNATLAWLGGGTIASGGLGMAGGTLVLGAAAAGPALLLAGWYMNAKSEKNLNDAYSNIEQARAFVADIRVSIQLTNGINDVAVFSTDTLAKLKPLVRRANNKLEDVLESHGVDYALYPQEAKNLVMRCVKLVQLLKAVIDTPILDNDGNLLGDAQANIFNIQKAIEG